MTTDCRVTEETNAHQRKQDATDLEWHEYIKSDAYRERLASEIAELMTNDADFIQEFMAGDYCPVSDWIEHFKAIGTAIHSIEPFDLMKILHKPMTAAAKEKAEGIISDEWHPV